MRPCWLLCHHIVLCAQYVNVQGCFRFLMSTERRALPRQRWMASTEFMREQQTAGAPNPRERTVNWAASTFSVASWQCHPAPHVLDKNKKMNGDMGD